MEIDELHMPATASGMQSQSGILRQLAARLRPTDTSIAPPPILTYRDIIGAARKQERSMKIEFKWSRFDALTTLQLYEIIQARESVFVVEQSCPYQETDGKDLHAWHLSVFADGELAAYARVVEPGFKYEQPSIGRVLTLAKFRNLKLGRALMTEAIRFTESTYPGQGIKIGAQARLESFYGSLGFETVTAPYSEDSIPHIDMVKPAPAQ